MTCGSPIEICWPMAITFHQTQRGGRHRGVGGGVPTTQKAQFSSVTWALCHAKLSSRFSHFQQSFSCFPLLRRPLISCEGHPQSLIQPKRWGPGACRCRPCPASRRKMHGRLISDSSFLSKVGVRCQNTRIILYNSSENTILTRFLTKENLLSSKYHAIVCKKKQW